MDDEKYNAFVSAYANFYWESYRSSVINIPRRKKDIENPRRRIRRIIIVLNSSLFAFPIRRHTYMIHFIF